MNLQVIASPGGDIVWVSGALPGSVHDKKAEWIWGVLAELEAAGLVTLADKGYTGAGDHVRVPYKGTNKPASQKDANRAHARLRGPGERANAPAQVLAHLAQAPQLPVALRAAGQSDPRSSDPRNQRMKRLSARLDRTLSTC